MAGVKNVHGLTDKEEKFAQAVAKGSTLTDAFKSCYSWENYTPDSMWKKASAINNRVDVRKRIETLQRENENTAVWARKDALEMLLRAATTAEDSVQEPIMGEDSDGKPIVVGYKYNAGAGSVVIKAVEAASKMCGYNEPEITENKVEIVIGGDADDYAG